MIIDGKSIATERLKQLGVRVMGLVARPKLVAILVGDDPASETYVSMKSKRGDEVGIESEIVRPQTQEELVLTIERLNRDVDVTGILVQLPLPKEFDTEKVLGMIDPQKDVDGLGGKSDFLPATVKAVLLAIDFARSHLAMQGETLMYVIVGQGKLVGMPLADYLENKGINVIRCDEFTSDLKTETLKGDVLVTATGVPGLIKADMVKPGAVVIDCGAPKSEVDPSVYNVAGAYTPVPGGIGPLTVACLLENLYNAAITHMVRK